MSQNDELPPLPSELIDAINECATSIYLTPTSQIKTISSLKNEIRDYACVAIAAQTAAPRGTDAQILKERELTASAIHGAMAYGYQNAEYPPDDSAWLRPFWVMGRRDAEREAVIAAQADDQGEPVCWIDKQDLPVIKSRSDRGVVDYTKHAAPTKTALFAHSAQAVGQSEPVAWRWDLMDGGTTSPRKSGVYLQDPELFGISFGHPNYKWTLLFDHPAPVRQPLTVEQIYACHDRARMQWVRPPVDSGMVAFARAIESAHEITAP